MISTFTISDSPSFSFDARSDAAKDQTMRIMEMVKPYFLSAYTRGDSLDKKIRVIHGELYTVERANHGLAHALRQGALAKDIFNFLVQCPISDFSGIVEWARRKEQLDPHLIQKIEMAASFQRSGRQCECSSTSSPDLYKEYEKQDTIYFRKHAEESSLFTNELDLRIFEEAILWSNPGILKEEIEDLKYLRRIIHTAHTLDLRRLPSFDAARIQQDAIDQLFGGSPSSELETLFKQLFWKRSGDYLEATGDRDLVNGRPYQDRFFIQSRNPTQLVSEIHRISQTSLKPHITSPALPI